MQVLLALTDNWQPTGGADQFVTWAGGQVHEDFFTDEAMKSMYKDHVAVLLNRVNTINGRVYKEDPTIFGFDLINEPRCFQCGNGLNQWIAEMSAYVKSIDSQHLITVGEEGKNTLALIFIVFVTNEVSPFLYTIDIKQGFTQNLPLKLIPTRKATPAGLSGKVSTFTPTISTPPLTLQPCIFGFKTGKTPLKILPLDGFNNTLLMQKPSINPFYWKNLGLGVEKSIKTLAIHTIT